MKEAGCSKIGWGIESLNKNSLENIKTGQKYKIDELKEALSLSNYLGIINRGYLMIGYPWETEKDIEKTFKSLKYIPIDELKVAFFTPFPGTPTFQKYKNLLTTNDPSHFTTDEPVVKVKSIKPRELIKIRRKIVKEFYQSKEYRERMKEKIKKFPYLMKSYNEFFDFLYAHGIVS
jgi:radical SAM superfamily enzyme YgiQ (UPF0313 family)